MKHIDHINFAKNILTVCRLEERAAYFANLPAFIGQSSYYNSLYTYALSHFPDLLDTTEIVFSSLQEKDNDFSKTKLKLSPIVQSLNQDIQGSKHFMQRYYYKKRLLLLEQLIESALEIKKQYLFLSGESDLPPTQFFKNNQSALFLAFISFAYFDLWINPKQLFFPKTSICSGSWNLWDEIDFFQLTESFFEKNKKAPICSQLYSEKIWNECLDCFAMIKAIIIRMGEMGSPSLHYSIVDWNIRAFLRYLGVNEYKRADTELEFLASHESSLNGLFKELFKKQ